MTTFATRATTTDLMQGWGSILSAIFAGAAFLVTVFLLRHEYATRREDRMRIESAQANLIITKLSSGTYHKAQQLWQVPAAHTTRARPASSQ